MPPPATAPLCLCEILQDQLNCVQNAEGDEDTVGRIALEANLEDGLTDGGTRSTSNNAVVTGTGTGTGHTGHSGHSGGHVAVLGIHPREAMVLR